MEQMKGAMVPLKHFPFSNSRFALRSQTNPAYTQCIVPFALGVASAARRQEVFTRATKRISARWRVDFKRQSLRSHKLIAAGQLQN